jgi:tetratricopeptide (TPR) repeat protein
MMLQHLPKEKDIHTLQSVLLSRVYKKKGDMDLSFYYLKKAESKALEIEAFELLAIIYAEIIKLSYDMVSIDVEEYIAKQKENTLKLDRIQEIDQILAATSYRIKTAQNFSRKNDAVLNVLEKAVKEFAKNKDIPKSPKFRFKVYLTISRILLQKHDFTALEHYLLHTYKEFTADKIFNKTNHEHKLMMLIYLTNCLYKTHKLKKSLRFAEILKKGMDEYGGFLRDKFLFYYYNALVINYSVLNKKEALKILEEARRNPIIKQLPTYTVFIYLNTALIYFDQGKYRMAIKNLSRLLLHHDFVDIGKSFQLKIYIASLIIRFELGDFDTIESRLKYMQRVYKEILENDDFKRDVELIEIISKLIYCNNLQQDKKLLMKVKTLITAIDDDAADDADVINYNLWLKSKL